MNLNPPKSPDRRQRRNKTTSIVPFPASKLIKVPPMPDGLLASTKETWEAFWRSSVAKVADPDTDLAAITRLFTLYDERERAYRAFREKRLIEGSQGQMVLNPMGRAMHEFDSEIRQMEDRLGLSPLSRLRMGIALGAAAKTMADMNRMLEDDDNDDAADGEAYVDPRQA